MSQQVISYADLSRINKMLFNMNSDMSTVISEIGNLNIKQNIIESELQKFANSFAEFVEADLKSKT